MRCKIRLYSVLLAALPMLTLIGCESANKSTYVDTPTVTVENFTTQDKPTKTVQTPWGDKQVYDPTQDPEIIEIFEYVSKQNKENGFRGREGLSSYKNLFKDVNQIQFNDMLRTGCVSPSFFESGCRKRPDYVKNEVPKNCPTLNFGKANLNRCEQQFLTSNPDDPMAPIQLGCLKLKGDYFDAIGSKQISDGFGEEGIDAYFSSYCTSYDGINFSNKWRTGH